MNHCRKVILLWIVMVVGLTLSCRKPTEEYRKAPEIEWMKVYGGKKSDIGREIQETSDGGYIIVATTLSFGVNDSDIWLLKTNAIGDTVWTRIYNIKGYDDPFSIQQTSDGGYILTGRTSAEKIGNLFLVKTDTEGKIKWTKIYGGKKYLLCYSNSVQQTIDGGYIVVGRVTPKFKYGQWPHTNIYLLKTNSIGNVLWTRTFEGRERAAGVSIRQTKDRGFIILAETNSFERRETSLYLVKTDSLGDTMWTRTYEKKPGIYGKSIQLTSDGGYIIVGSSGNNFYLIRANEKGDTLWTRTFDKSDYDAASYVRETKDKGYVIIGTTWNDGSRNIYIIKTNSSGDSLWTGIYGEEDDEWGNCVLETSDGGYILVGSKLYYSEHGPADILLIKLKPEE